MTTPCSRDEETFCLDDDVLNCLASIASDFARQCTANDEMAPEVKTETHSPVRGGKMAPASDQKPETNEKLEHDQHSASYASDPTQSLAQFAAARDEELAFLTVLVRTLANAFQNCPGPTPHTHS